MRFILWTFVWSILCIGNTIVDVWLMGGWKKYSEYYSSTVIGIASGIEIFLWIFLYVKFIKQEK